MRLTLPNLIVLLIVIGTGAWWLLGDDDEAQVRAAHAELVGLLDKSADEEGISVRRIRALQTLFAANTTVSGAADGLAGSYAPDDIVRIVLAGHERYQRIDLSFTEPVVSFPSQDAATAGFTAVLTAYVNPSEAPELSETRAVTSRMQRVDDDWVFTGFVLAEEAGP